ncbi:MAG TPA: hypothetical protein PKA58_28230, partial [Polyangium sp.]|nr:hypothetical protein [Polyangium sp.]
MFDGIGAGTAIAGAAGLAAAGGLAYMAYQHFSQPSAPAMPGAPGVPGAPGMPAAQAQPGFFQNILGSSSGPIPPGGAPAMGAGPGYPGSAMPGLPQGGGMPNYGVPQYHNDPSSWGTSAPARQAQPQWGGAPNLPPQGGAAPQ